MVCVPCFIVPVILLIWRFILWPLLRPLYVRWYNITDGKTNKTVENLDKLGEEECPFGCPMKTKVSPAPDDEDKKTL